LYRFTLLPSISISFRTRTLARFDQTIKTATRQAAKSFILNL
jgi:hypothetical protein